MMQSARQSRMASLLEAIANTVVGYVLAVLLQHVVFAVLGIAIGLGESALIAAVFTAMSIVRSYLLRRLFERLADQRRAARWQRDGRLASRLSQGRA